jgi:transcriptional regulator
MYVPRHFAVDDLTHQHELIERHSFGTLIVALDGRLEAVHLPFLLDRDNGKFGTLRAHIARANPAWRGFDGKTEALVIFLGTHGYISPDWYTSPRQVPTWNYVSVHAYGVPKALDDDATVRLLDDLSAHHEGELAPKPPWTTAKLEPDYFAKLRGAIVAFELELSRLEGKAKLSQNKTASDVAGAVASLRARGNDASIVLADLMAAPADLDPKRR